MFKNLSPGAVGIRGLSLAEQIDLAAKTGFGGIDFSIREAAGLADEHGVEYVRALFANSGRAPWAMGPARRLEQRRTMGNRPGRPAQTGRAGTRVGLHAHRDLVSPGLERPHL